MWRMAFIMTIIVLRMIMGFLAITLMLEAGRIALALGVQKASLRLCCGVFDGVGGVDRLL